MLLDTCITDVALTAGPFGELVATFANADVGLLRRTRVQKHVFWHVGNSSLSKLRVESIFVSFGVGVGCSGVSYKGTASAADFDLSRTSVTVKVDVGLRVLLKEEEMGGVDVEGFALSFSAVRSSTETLALTDEQKLDDNSKEVSWDDEMISAVLMDAFSNDNEDLEGTLVVDGNKTVSF